MGLFDLNKSYLDLDVGIDDASCVTCVWRRGVVVNALVKLLYAGPGYYLSG